MSWPATRFMFTEPMGHWRRVCHALPDQLCCAHELAGMSWRQQ